MTRPTRIPAFGFVLGFAAALLIAGEVAAGSHEGSAERAAVVGESVTLTGKVVSVDAQTRTVVVEGELGRRVEIVAPEDAPNFSQIKVGDPVIARYVEALALAIAPEPGAEPGVTATAAVSSSPPGSTPARAMAEVVELRAVVKAVDPATRSVTLALPAGGERTLKVEEDIDLEKVEVGEQVSVTHTRAFAIGIDKRE